MLPSENLNRKGFTLVEIILALMIASIMAGFLTVYFDVSFQNGGAAVSDLQKSLRLHSVMEKISVDYSNKLAWKTANRYRSGTKVITSSNEVYQIDSLLSSNPCISGGTEPQLLSLNDGGCTWKTATTEPLVKLLENNVVAGAYAWFHGAGYIDYTEETEFVKFSGTSPNYTEIIDPASDILKVTISSTNGERLTAYFPEP